MIDATRRRFLKYGLGAGALGAAVAAGLLPRLALAAADASAWPEKAFREKNEEQALTDMYGSAPVDNDAIKLNVPEIAENGAVVPVAIDATAIPDVTEIAIFVDKNPFPLTASYEIPQGTLAYVSSRVKMQETAIVTAVVKAGGKVWRTAKEVKVTIGGCGG